MDSQLPTFLTRAALSLGCVMCCFVLPARAEPPQIAAAQGEEVVSGDLPNLSTLTLGGGQFWSDELVFHHWRIQKNVLTGHYRLLDESEFRRAWGTFEQCREKLAALRHEEGLPAMRGPAVITLHGLIRSRDTMEGIGQFLKEEGNYTWLNVSYASTRRSLDDHAASLAEIISHLEGIDEINFVCHSLGNLVVRRYLGEAHQPQPRWKVDSRIKRFVMLGPPNNGAQFAALFKNNKIFGLLLGPSGKQLASDWSAVDQGLATPQCEFGIIAGRGTAMGANPIVSGEDDMVVSVDETRLPGACDFLVVPQYHGGLMNDASVRKSTLKFLKEGCFTSAEARRPIHAELATPAGEGAAQ